MIMDSKYKQFSDHQTSSETDDLSYILNYDHFRYTEDGYVPNIPSPDLNFMSIPFDSPDSEPINSGLSLPMNLGGDPFVPPTASAALISDGGESSDFGSGFVLSPATEDSLPSGDSSSSDPVMKYLGEMLMEENIDDNVFRFGDLIALRHTEESLYNVIGEEYPSSVGSPLDYLNEESPESSNQSGSVSGFSPSISTSTSTGAAPNMGTVESFDPQLNSSLLEADLPNWHSYDPNLQQDVQPNVQLYEIRDNRVNDVHAAVNGLSGTSASEMVQNMFSDNESVMLFKKGLEEASKFLSDASLLSIDPGSNSFASGRKEDDPKFVVNNDALARGTLTNSWRSRKTHGREDSDLEEGRSNKQSAVSVEENVSTKDGDLSEMFDKVLLLPDTGCFGCAATGQLGANKTVLFADEQSNEPKGRKVPAKITRKKKESVDLRALLILCAQAISANDFRTANELLKQIRQHSSPQGDGSQRLAHYLANGLEARLAGRTTGVESFHVGLITKKTTAADLLKAYQTLMSACPFKKLAILFLNKTIFYAAENAATIHVVDFGVLYGYQWPMLIQFLSSRPGGPPKLRITGIEFPQRGLRPAERIQETGRRLAKYCQRFNVPFEYRPIAEQHWENIRVEDLGIKRNEFTAVNCLCRFKILLDETGDGDCPRDAVLNLIRRINPNIFIHTEINGSYNSPFFVTRFRETLFHYSSTYDMFDCTLARDDPERLTIEAEFYGSEAINAVACEGWERVERPETYKQWQARTLRAGFKQLPLNQELLIKLRKELENNYHKDFVIDQDGQWMLQGWKGRILYASTCWVPA